ncbi:Uncharacterized protein FWK35_00013085 [Aphis craccivora]|uniref:Uncharacterized protein n=1 Tax=Aphis craccivora TaxID=307492 RepID=A0A6G0Z450_APHCR|nr:Uncharacterized protein FWK35_00013085 [Aphis craccivora]
MLPMKIRLVLGQDRLHSERSDECINFTMMCFFFVSVYGIISRNNDSISNFGGGFQWKIQKLITFKFLRNLSKTRKLKNNLHFGVFRPSKYKPPFSPTTGNYILMRNHLRSELFFKFVTNQYV